MSNDCKSKKVENLILVNFLAHEIWFAKDSINFFTFLVSGYFQVNDSDRESVAINAIRVKLGIH